MTSRDDCTHCLVCTLMLNFAIYSLNTEDFCYFGNFLKQGFTQYIFYCKVELFLLHLFIYLRFYIFLGLNWTEKISGSHASCTSYCKGKSSLFWIRNQLYLKFFTAFLLNGPAYFQNFLRYSRLTKFIDSNRPWTVWSMKSQFSQTSWRRQTCAPRDCRSATTNWKTGYDGCSGGSARWPWHASSQSSWFGCDVSQHRPLSQATISHFYLPTTS